jgi:transcriptional regulator with XRE-family HTH domain
MGSGRHYAQRFARMLELFPHPAGRRWRGKDFEVATNNYVTGSYITALKKGRIENPGVERLRAISEVMGAPFEMWLEEPEDWGRAPGEAGAPEGGSETLKDLIEYLFGALVDERSGKPYSNRDVSSMTQGRLSEDDVTRMRSGELQNPTRGQLLALSDAFDIDPSYWFGRGQRKPVLDSELSEALRNDKTYALLNKSLSLDDGDKDIVMSLMEQLEARRGRGKGQSTQ